MDKPVKADSKDQYNNCIQKLGNEWEVTFRNLKNTCKKIESDLHVIDRKLNSVLEGCLEISKAEKNIIQVIKEVDLENVKKFSSKSKTKLENDQKICENSKCTKFSEDYDESALELREFDKYFEDYLKSLEECEESRSSEEDIGEENL